MNKTMIIVGAGIAGHSTGCDAQLNGYRSTIFEMHSIPGGLCTAWTRKGYTFDTSMHNFRGSMSGPFHTMWQELGVLKNLPIHYHQEAMRVESLHRSLSFCTDADPLLDQLKTLSPADAKLSGSRRTPCGQSSSLCGLELFRRGIGLCWGSAENPIGQLKVTPETGQS